MDLALERASQDVGDVAAAHPAHEGQDLAVVDVAEERAARLALELRALEIEDLLLARGIGQRDLDEMIEASRRHERRIDDIGAAGGRDDQHARRRRVHRVELLAEGCDQARARLTGLRRRQQMIERQRVGLVEKEHARLLPHGDTQGLLQDLAGVRAELRGEVQKLQVIEDRGRRGGERARECRLSAGFAGRPPRSNTRSSTSTGALARIARAIASDGRESSAISAPFTRRYRVAKYVLSRKSLITTRLRETCRRPNIVRKRSCVSGRGGVTPCNGIAMPVASATPMAIANRRRSRLPSSTIAGC